MSERFCPHCGAELAQKLTGGRERPACAVCGYVRFGRFSLGVGGVVWQAGRVLLVQRGEDPGRGRWTIPGGYVEEDETPDEAVVREVWEETGLRTRATRLLAIRNSLRGADQNAYYVFALELAGPPDITVDGQETVQADFFALADLDHFPDLAPMSRWAAVQAAAPGMVRLPDEANLRPLVGTRWALYAGS